MAIFGEISGKSVVNTEVPATSAGGHIDRVGKEEDERAHELQRAGIDREAVRQVLRERDGIVRRLGEGAQSLGAQDPVGRRTDGKADADPHLAEAEGEDRAGQAHQQPRGHIGRLRGQGGDPGPMERPPRKKSSEFLFVPLK